VDFDEIYTYTIVSRSRYGFDIGRRQKITTAEEYIDTHYPASDPRSVLLDDILAPYRNQVDDA